MEGLDATLAASIVDSILTTRDLRRVLSITAEQLGSALSAARSIALLNVEDKAVRQPPIEWSEADTDPALDNELLTLAKHVQRLTSSLPRAIAVHQPGSDPLFAAVYQQLKRLEISSLLAVTTRCNGVPNATLLLLRTGPSGPWREDEINVVDYVAHFFGMAVGNCLAGAGAAAAAALPGIDEKRTAAEAAEKAGAAPPSLAVAIASAREPVAEQHYHRLVDNSDAVIFHINANHEIKFINNRSVDLFGVDPKEISGSAAVKWYDLVHPEDRENVRSHVEDIKKGSLAFEEEFRVINSLTGRERWLLAKFVPVHNADGELYGWDGFAVDITARREAQEALDAQSKKVRALYTVSSAIRGYLDPANIASRGLAALCEATGADAGLCYLYPSRDTEKLSLVAHHGFSVDFAQKSELISSVESLSTYVAEHGQSVVVPDMRSDPRCSRLLAEEEGVRSSVLVPISVEDETLGTLALFHRRVAQFDGGDVMLVAAAANQIGLASRQANLFAAYRKQTKKLAALYRISHELSGFLSLDETFQKAFTIIRDELDLRRLWLGLLNETGTRIIGTAAYGPGWKKRLVEMNVEIIGRDHPIAQVVTTRKAMIIKDPEQSLSRFGVRRFFSRYSISAVGLVPLVSGGQVLGVLAFQADGEEVKLDEEQMTLISSLASEIAATVLAKRLEERIAQGDKMRAAGLLAAGIAHNFNNLLQAILGQASLLEMQFPNEEKVRRPARTINDSATKGAALVRQLVSFANLEEPSSEVCDVNAVVERGFDTLTRNLRERHHLVLHLGENLPRAYVDPGQLMRILVTLVRNASEAMERGGTVQVFTDSTIVDRESPHYEVPYGAYIRVGVRDEGVGMDAETRRRCFEPFFTTKNLDPSSGLSLSGAGLGLAAAYALARKNGGRLVVDSRKGYGSVFTLYLPVNQEVADEKEPDEFPERNELEEAQGMRVRPAQEQARAARESLKIEVEKYDESASEKRYSSQELLGKRTAPGKKPNQTPPRKW